MNTKKAWRKETKKLLKNSLNFGGHSNVECTQNLGQIIWKLVFYLLKLSLRKVIWKKYIDEFKMLILELLEEGKIEIIKKQSYIFK